MGGARILPTPEEDTGENDVDVEPISGLHLYEKTGDRRDTVLPTGRVSDIIFI